jgi:polyhydroxyalkanoate synthesis regulator phasin
MADPIRTPDDEVATPGWFLPPFTAGWWYEGQTYGGHTDFSVDWNRRTQTGGWLQDDGDPVLAAADGTVAVRDLAEGLVMLNHPGMFRTEYRHMRDITVKIGDKVQRGDRVGSIGAVGSNADITSPHLHHRHWKRPAAGKPFAPIRMAFEGRPVATSVGDSDSKPKTWTPPKPVMVQGPPPRATWQSAYQQADRRMTRAEKLLDDCGTAKGALEGELKAERGSHALTRAERDGALARAANEQGRADAALRDLETATRTITDQGARIEALERRVAELEALPPPDCVAAVNAERVRVLDAVSDGMDELVAGLR